MAEQKRNGTQQPRGRIDHSGRNTPKKNNNENRISPAIIKLLIVLALVVLAVALWNNRVELSCANVTQCARDNMAMCGSGEGFPSTINGSSAASVESLAGSSVALLSDTALTVYDNTAQEIAVRAHFMSEPAMKAAGRYAVLIDLGSTDFRIESAAETISTGDSELPLISCAVSRNCRYAMVMQGSSRGEAWLSSVEVFDREGNSLHKWHCADWYLTDAALSANGEYLALSGINASDGDLNSAIIIQKVGSSEQIAEYTLGDNIYLWLEYSNDGTLFGIGSTALTVVSANGTERRDISHSGNLTAYDVCYDGGAVLCTDNGVGSRVTLYDVRGNERCSVNAEHRIRSASLSGEACAVLGDGSMTAMRLDGTVIGTTETNASIGGLLLIDRRAYTVDGMRISAWDWS